MRVVQSISQRRSVPAELFVAEICDISRGRHERYVEGTDVVAHRNERRVSRSRRRGRA
jgi:hypothetical protein